MRWLRRLRWDLFPPQYMKHYYRLTEWKNFSWGLGPIPVYLCAKCTEESYSLDFIEHHIITTHI